MPQAKPSLLCIFIAFVSCSGEVFAETVKLKDGSVIHGSIVQMTQTALTIETADMGQIQIRRRAIQGFEDDATPVTAPELALSPLVASLPSQGDPAGIDISNNNANTNAALTSSSPDAAATGARSTVEPTVEATVNAPQPELLDGQGDGFSLGSVNVGVSFLRLKDSEVVKSSDLSSVAWSDPTPTLQWDLIGYRWKNGFGLTAFAELTSKNGRGRSEREGYQGGLRGDFALRRQKTRFGSGTVYAGLGVAAISMTTKKDLEQKADQVHQPNQPQLVIERSGFGGVARLAYQVVGTSGIGLNVGLSLSHSALRAAEVDDGTVCSYNCPEYRVVLQTAALTSGLAYAF